MYSFRCLSYFLCFVFQTYCYAVLSKDCIGLQCHNGGTVTQQIHECRCVCSAGFSGQRCEYKPKTSVWPKGPFYLIMPKEGCPETKAAGWEIGYINFTTKFPFKSNELYDNASKTSILGPFGHQTLQINFCYKSGDHTMNLPSEWPNWNFEIFRADEGCPAGFKENRFVASMPPLRYWNVDGSVPSVRVNESFVDNKTYVSFALCKRIPDTNNVSVLLDSAAFIFLKDPNISCNMSGLDQDYSLTEERFLTRFEGWYDTNSYQQELQVCYYKKGKANSIANGPVIEGDSQSNPVAKGWKELPKYYYGYDSEPPDFDDYNSDMGNVDDGRNILFMIGFSTISCDVMGDCQGTWLMIDARESIILDSIYMPLPNKKIYDFLLSSQDDSEITVYIGNLRWGFLQNGAHICDYVKDISQHEAYFNCIRKYEGRYVTIFSKQGSILQQFERYSFSLNEHIFLAVSDSTETDAEPLYTPCNKDLGMEDFTIQDFQIKASSHQIDYPAYFARPGLQGWCASVDDIKPYIQVDILSLTLIDGISIINWYEESFTQDNDIRIIKRGSRSFSIEYGISQLAMTKYSEKSFTIDTSLQLNEPMVFIFYKPFITRYIRIFPTALQSHTCLKFEMFGCKKTGQPTFYCKNDPTRELVDNTPTLITSIIPTLIFSNVTLAACRGSCVRNQEICNVVEHYSDSTCKIFSFDETQDVKLEQMKRPLKENSAAVQRTVYSGAFICWKDAFEIYSPRFLRRGSFSYELRSTSTSIQLEPFQERMIFNYGYPFSCGQNQLYEWIVNGFHNIKLLFIDIFLHSSEAEESCFSLLCNTDSILVSTDSLGTVQEYQVSINSSQNGKERLIRTDKRTIYIYLRTSVYNAKHGSGNRRGFKALVYEEEIAECGIYFHLAKHNSFGCNVIDIMRFASHTFWEMKEITTTFTSYRDRNKTQLHRVRLEIEFFDVSCFSASKFVVTGLWSESTICNRFKPAADLVLYGSMLIDFTYSIGDVVHPVEGFSIKVHIENFNDVIFNEIKSNLQEVSDQGQSKICQESFHKCYSIHSVLRGITWVEAAKYCESQNMYLLSMKNRREMEYIRQVLQVFSVIRATAHDFITTKVMNAKGESFTHIGLFRYRNSENEITERWADGSPPTFTAWSKEGRYLNLLSECTIMDFLNMSVVNSWQRRPCTFVAKHFVCERKTIYDTNISDQRRFSKPDLKEKQHALFQCLANEWTSITSRCNGINECSNGIDERGCIDTGNCERSSFRCDNGECIQISKVCNFFEDCEDGSDEYCEFPDCIQGTEAACDNRQCIPNYQFCDGVEHCLDGSDEIYCAECNVSTSFACVERRCIPIALYCDGYADCKDGDDEACFRSYRSCDDVLMDGYRQSGYYLIANTWMECDFDFETGEVTMTFRDNDWYHLEGGEDKQYGIITNGEGCISLGYSSTQKITQRLSNNQQYILEKWNPKNISVIIHEEALNYTDRKQLDFKGFRIYAIENTRRVEIFGEKKYGQHDYVINMGPVICTKDIANITNRASVIRVPKFISSKVPSKDYWSYLTPCGTNMLPVYLQTPCIYNTDGYRVVDGCRTFEHLKECESAKCGPDYFKCPDSYCVPYSLVCDGNVHCPDGEDENNIYCQFHSTVGQTFIFYTGTSEDLAQAAHTLGTQLFKTTNRVCILHHEKTVQTAYLIRMYYITSVAQLRSRVSSEHRVSVDSPYTDVIRLFSIRPNQTSLFIWLQEQASTKKMFSIVMSTLNFTFTYEVELDQGNRKKIKRLPGSHFNERHVTLDSWKLLRTTGYLLFPEAFNGIYRYDIKIPNDTDIARQTCENGYRCPFTRICIPLQLVCDGRKHCPYGDDEMLCDFKCPDNCTCEETYAVCRNYNGSVFPHLSLSTRGLDASYSFGFNGTIDIRSDLSYLIRLNSSYSGVAIIANDSFSYTKNLLILDLSFNRFTVLLRDMFKELKFLRVLYLIGNNFISHIDAGAYNNLRIKHIEIKNTKLMSIVKTSFVGLNLTTLDLAENSIKVVEDYAFEDLTVTKLDISSNPIQSFGKDMFTGVKDLQQLKTPAYKFCCVRPVYLDERNCYPQRDEFSSCADLMRSTTLQFLLWIVGILALLGNILSVSYRLVYDRKRLNIGYGIFVTNLAVADFLMGVYMIIIAVADQVFRNRYIEEDERWRSSFWCSLAGVLSTVSSESSVVFICLITLDRILVIKYPFGTVRITTKIAKLASLLCWVGSFVIAITPVVAHSYFKNQFYSKSAVCLALPLTNDRSAGWLYAIAIFIGFNFITFVLIALGQMLIYFDIRKQSRAMKHMSSARRNDLKVARNLLLLVTTDFACWFPVGCMGIMSLSGHTVPGDVYAWTAVLVLPINSALNPFLYTFSAIISKKKFTPSADEQERAQITKCKGKAILQAYKFCINANGTDATDCFKIEDIASNSELNMKDKLLIFMHLLKCIIYHHKNQLVFQKFDSDSVVIHISKTDQVCKRLWIQLHRMPVMSNNRRHRMDDMYEIGKLLQKLIE